MRLHSAYRPATFVLKLKYMLSTDIEKQILQHYRSIANTIVQKHVDVLSLSFSHTNGSAHEHLNIFNKRLKLINNELTANAEKMLNEVKANTCIDSRKLQEHLFVIRKDYFNEFLKKSELNLIPS